MKSKQSHLYTAQYYQNNIENLYYESGDGEISIFQEYIDNELELYMVICIDISTLFKEKRGKAFDLIEKLSKIKDENLVEIFNWWYIEDQVIFIEAEAPIYQNPSGLEEKPQKPPPGGKVPSEVSKSWKTYCKKKFSEEELFDIIKRVSKGLGTLHQHELIHRDVHPSRI